MSRRRSTTFASSSIDRRTSDIEAEYATPLIGCALANQDDAEKIIAYGVTPDWFYNPQHSDIFSAITRCRTRGLPDVMALLRKENHDEYADCLHGFVDHACPSGQVEHHVGKLRELHDLRAMRQLGSYMVEASDKGELSSILKTVQAKIDELQNGRGCDVERADIETIMAEKPPPHDAIFVGQVDAGRLCALIAKAKQRKSFFTLQAAICLATGRDFLAWEVPIRRRVMLVQFEVHPDDMHRRIYWMAEAMGVNVSDLDGWLIIHNAKASKWDGGGLEAVNDIGRVAKDEGIEVLIVDPIFRLQRDGNENIEFMRPLVLAFDKITIECGALVWLVHHDTKGSSGDRDHFDRGSGSNVLGRAVYWSVTMTPHECGDPLYSCIEAGGNGYPPSPGFTIEFVDGRFVHRDDVHAAKMTSRTRRKANRPDMAVMKAHALQLVGIKSIQLEMFIPMFLKQTGLSERKAREVRSELISDGVLEVSERERVRGGPKYIGTPEAIASLHRSWGAE